MKTLNFALPVMILALVILACGGKTETEEVKSGRLRFVQTLNYGSVGTHGGQGWYVSDSHFYVNDDTWSPDGIKVKDIGGCDASPNKTVEALKCYDFADQKESVHILRMKADKPEWITASDSDYQGGKNLGEWVGDGHWLIYKDYYFNLETSEKREIKGLPDFPKNYFRATSPDLDAIVYEETCFVPRYDLPPGASVEKETDKQCKLHQEHLDKGIAAFWLIDARTGTVKILELRKDKYDWLTWKQEQFRSRSDWLDYFQKQLVWEKDKKGKYQLSYPN
jgi:hypothetical protein